MKLSCWLLIAVLITPLGLVSAQNTLKSAQERAVLNLLRLYETNVNALVPKLAANLGKPVKGVADFEKTLFVSNKALIINHVAVKNLQLDSLTNARMQETFLNPETFLQLCAGVFKGKFTYKLDLSSAKVIGQKALADSAGKGVLKTGTAQVLVGVSIQGTNGALQIKQTDTLRFEVEFTGTSNRNVVSARIQRILKASGGPTPPEEPIEPASNTKGVKAKVDSLLSLISGLTSAKDTQAVQYRVYKRMLPRFVAEEGKYHIQVGKDSVGQKLFATDFGRVDSLRHRKYQFEKALLAFVSYTDSAPDKPRRITTDYFFGSTFRGGELQYQKTYKVTEETSHPRFSHPGWWIDEIWLREIPPKKSKSTAKDAIPNN